MTILVDGLSVFYDQRQAVFSILITILWGQSVFIAVLRKLYRPRLAPSEYISIGSAGWILPVFIMTLAVFVFHFWFGKVGVVLVVSSAVVIFLLSLFYLRELLPAFALFICILIVPVVIRLAYISELALPLYFDSAEHYRIIKYLSAFLRSHTFDIPTVNYYHIGFHLVSAAFVQVFDLNIVDVMLVFGQIILAILPFSLFYIFKQESGSSNAAIFTCLLAGFGWHMPYHLMNWGKYPALLSLVCIILVVNNLYIGFKNENRKAVYVLSSFFALISFFIHSRTLIVFVCIAISCVLTIWFKNKTPKTQVVITILMLAIITFEVWIINKDPILLPLVNGYFQGDKWMLFLALTLLPFAILYFPAQSFFLLGSLTLFMLGLFIPVPIPKSGLLPLLDRPYVQMLLYLPLSLLGGFGLAGLFRMVNKKQLEYVLMLLFSGLVVWNATANQDFYPSDCCQIVTRDDLAAIQWLDATTQPNTPVIIAYTDLYVSSFEQKTNPSGVDAGIWIRSLTSRNVIFLEEESNFELAEVHNMTCEVAGESYIYVGGMPQSFDTTQLEQNPEWYQLVFALPRARIYQVVGC